MAVSPSHSRSSIALKRIGGALNQWEELKMWQIRQEELLGQSSPKKNEGRSDDRPVKGNGLPTDPGSQRQPSSSLDADVLSLLMESKTLDALLSFDMDDDANSDKTNCLEPRHLAERNNEAHDLSIIHEVDEDSRTTIDLTTSDSSEAPTRPQVQKLPLSVPSLRIVSDFASAKNDVERPPVNHETTDRPKRPFLRKGQGLVRFNMRPDEARRPYQNGRKPPPTALKPALKPTRSKPELDCPIALSQLRLKKDSIPANRSHENQASQRNTGPELSTWSHLLALDRDERENGCRGERSDIAGVQRIDGNAGRQDLLGSPKRKGALRCATGLSQEEDEESLAAYLALEQHVSNTSFCSTSSRVDRLVAKSFRSHPTTSPCRLISGPNYSSLMEEESDVCHTRSTNSHQNQQQLENPRQRNLEFKHVELQQPTKPWTEAARTMLPVMNDKHLDETLESDWEAEAEELKRLKSSHFTAGGIEVEEAASDESFSESVSESSEEEDIVTPSKPINPLKSSDLASLSNLCDTSTASVDLVIESINRKVEDHLTRLCVEIETLQKSNNSAKKRAKSLKKQVRHLERKLATEHLASERKLAEEREAAAKTLSEERAKFAREKANFDRFCREKKKEQPSPVLMEEVERLRKDIVSKEEKWRAERAKARGTECNLRIQITNLKKDNEKLKAENSKLKREKETALNAAKAKNVSNTKVINAIAQHLSKAKPQVCVIKEKESIESQAQERLAPISKKGTSTSAPVQESTSKKTGETANRLVPTIGVFPPKIAPPTEDKNREDDWLSSDEEVDLGPNTPERFDEELEKAITDKVKEKERNGLEPLSASLIAETEARYDALFNNSNAVDPRSKENPTANHQAENNVVVHADGSVERRKSNGTSVVTLPDGTQRRHGKNGSVMTVPPSGWPIQVTYYNGDKLERHEDGTVHYFYSKTQTWQTTHPDGREEVRLPNGIVGDRKDGSLVVKIPSESKVNAVASGGATSRRDVNDSSSTCETVVVLPNGDQEIRTKDYVTTKLNCKLNCSIRILSKGTAKTFRNFLTRASAGITDLYVLPVTDKFEGEVTTLRAVDQERRFQDGTVRYLYSDGVQKTIYTSGRIRVKGRDGNLLMDTAASHQT